MTTTGLECDRDPRGWGCIAHRVGVAVVARPYLGNGEYDTPRLLDAPRLIGITPELLDAPTEGLTVTVTPDAADVGMCDVRYQLVAYCDVERALVGERQ